MAVSRVHARKGKRPPRPDLPLFTGKVITRAKLPKPKEIVLHMAVVHFLEKWCRNDWEWTHFPAGEYRDEITAKKLENVGTKPGWPDLIFVSPPGRFHGLELKRLGEKLSDTQEAYHARARARGWKIAVVDTFDDAVVVLKDWGCLRIKISDFKI